MDLVVSRLLPARNRRGSRTLARTKRTSRRRLREALRAQATEVERLERLVVEQAHQYREAKQRIEALEEENRRLRDGRLG